MAGKKQYELIKSARRTLSVEVRVDGTVIVRAPKKCPQSEIDRFLRERQDWIQEKLLLMKARQQDAEKVQPLSEEEQKLSKETAREALEQKLRYYAPKMGVTYGRVSVRDQKTRWGSCSSEGNLNFNWRLIMAPPGVEFLESGRRNHAGLSEIQKVAERKRKYFAQILKKIRKPLDAKKDSSYNMMEHEMRNGPQYHGIQAFRLVE